MRNCSFELFHIHLVLIVLLEYFKVTKTTAIKEISYFKFD